MARKHFPVLEINRIIILNFYFPTTGLLREPFLNDICLCYNDTPCRNCSSIITINREISQILKSQCWRFQACHKLWNWKGQEIPYGDENEFNTMMKLTLWVQFTLKKSNVDGKNLLYLKDPTCQKLCLFISVLLKISFHRSFCLIPQLWLPCSSFEFRSNYGKSDDFEIEEPWNIWKAICKAPTQKN